MNPDDAKQNLHPDRRSSDAVAEPARSAAEAWAALYEGSELQRVIDQEEAFDRAFSDKLMEIPIPPGLLEDILEAARKAPAPSRAETPPPASPIPFAPAAAPNAPRQSFWRSPRFWGLAASIMLLLSVFFASLGTPAQAGPDADLQSFLKEIDRTHRQSPDLHPAQNLELIRQILETAGHPVPLSLPENLQTLQSIGCQPLQIDGRTVSLICLRDKEPVHLYIFERQYFPAQKDLEAPHIQSLRYFCCATWTDQTYIYVLVTEHHNQERLHRLL